MAWSCTCGMTQNRKRFHAMLCTPEEEIAEEVGNTLEWALDHLENALNDEP